MTPSEFKAWFEGFTESMDGPPSLKQWEKIQARVKQITGQPVSYPVFVDRYLPSIWSGPHYYTGGLGIQLCNSTAASNGSVDNTFRQTAAGPGIVNYSTLNAGHCDGKVGAVAFDSHSAMNSLGRADAAELAA